MDQEQTVTAEELLRAEVAAKTNGKPNGHQPRGYPPIALRPPDPRRAKDTVLGVEIGGKLESDGTLTLRCAADAVDAARATWAAACQMHVEELRKVSVLHPEPAAQLKSRAWFFAEKQRALKRCDAALGELRTEVKELEAQIAKATVPPRSRDDLAGQLFAGEVRAWLRSANEAQRLTLVEKAIAAGDARVVVAALEVPLLSGLTPERAALLLGRWRRQQCPDELARLEVLQQTAAKVTQAAERLQRRFDEGFDHTALDRLEASTGAA